MTLRGTSAHKNIIGFAIISDMITTVQRIKPKVVTEELSLNIFSMPPMESTV